MAKTDATIGQSKKTEKTRLNVLRSRPLSAMLALDMGGVIRYRGREISGEQIEFIRGLVADNPTASRRALSVKLCEAWDWRQANGQLRDMVCRGSCCSFTVRVF